MNYNKTVIETNPVGRGTSKYDFAGMSLKNSMQWHKQSKNIVRDMFNDLNSYSKKDKNYYENSRRFRENYFLARRVETAYGLYLSDGIEKYKEGLDLFKV